jgi:GNAT superfamily N-acetyltransferase
MSRVDQDFIAAHTMTTLLPSGIRVKVRPVLPEDKEVLVEGMRRMSPESRYRRFMTSTSRLTKKQLIYLTEIDYHDHFAAVAFTIDEPGAPAVGVARYVRTKDEPEVAEAAVAVIDAYHGRGIGSFLLQVIGAVAISNGIRRFRGYVLSANDPARDVVVRLGAEIRPAGSGLLMADVDLANRMEDLADSPLYAVLRSAAQGRGLQFYGGEPADEDSPAAPNSST